MEFVHSKSGMTDNVVGALAMKMYRTRKVRPVKNGQTIFAPSFRDGEAAEYVLHHSELSETITTKIVESTTSGDLSNYNAAEVVESGAEMVDLDCVSPEGRFCPKGMKQSKVEKKITKMKISSGTTWGSSGSI